MSDYSGVAADNSQQRVKGVTLVKPVVFGNVSKQFGKKRDNDGHTHEWTVYFKPYDNEDMSQYIKKVHFKLHESYANPNRVVSKPPYEVSETGWGEFEVQVKIHFNDAANEKPLIFYHVLKLFHGSSSGGGSGSSSSGTGGEAGALPPPLRQPQQPQPQTPETPPGRRSAPSRFRAGRPSFRSVTTR